MFELEFFPQQEAYRIHNYYHSTDLKVALRLSDEMIVHIGRGNTLEKVQPAVLEAGFSLKDYFKTPEVLDLLKERISELCGHGEIVVELIPAGFEKPDQYARVLFKLITLQGDALQDVHQGGYKRHFRVVRTIVTAPGETLTLDLIQKGNTSFRALRSEVLSELDTVLKTVVSQPGSSSTQTEPTSPDESNL